MTIVSDQLSYVVKDRRSQDIPSQTRTMRGVAPRKKKPRREPARRKIDPWDRAFGTRLQIARAGAKLSQQRMADKLEVPLDTYQKYEHGKRSFPKHLIEKVVRLTQHGPWFLLTGEPEAHCPAYPTHPTPVASRSTEPIAAAS
jgi:ribosome-binding protein aMBF1 (putative translation factor)